MKKVSSLRRFRIFRHAAIHDHRVACDDGAVLDARGTTVSPAALPPAGELLATAETNWAFIDYASNRPVRIPPEIAGAFEVIPDALG